MIDSKYRVKQVEEDVLPEETLMDSSSTYSSVEVPIRQNTFRIFYVIVSFSLLFFAMKAFDLQVVQGAYFAGIADHSRLSYYPIPSQRGIIFDSKGKSMVENVPAFDLIGVTRDILSWDNSREYIYDVSIVLGMQSGELEGLIEKNVENAVFSIKKQLTKQEAISIQTMSVPGLHVTPYAQRYYSQGRVSGHVIGYTSNITPKELKKSTYYLATDKVGRIGLESSFEDKLRGDHIFYDLDTGSQIHSELYSPGDNLHLYMDIDSQKKLFDIMSDSLRESGIDRGAAIVQDVNTGGVLAMVSFPSFDPNAFERSANPKNHAYIEKTLSNNFNPLFNRVVSGLYSPGSTVKPLLALAGLQENVVDTSTIVKAEGYISVQSEIDPEVYYVYNDWKVHGWTDIKKAISDSVDVYFYALGGGGYGGIDGLGIEKISEYYKKFGADLDLKIDLPAASEGIVPDRKWKLEYKGEQWYLGDTYNVSIGQGNLLVTPMWINAYIGAIANGGNLMRPTLVKEIQDHEGRIVKKSDPEILKQIDMNKSHLEVVRSGMRQTITSGTARSLSSLPVKVAGKTGTAQVIGTDLNSLFTVYGPYENPEIVMTVIFENITDSQVVSSHVAKDFLAWYFDPARGR